MTSCAGSRAANAVTSVSSRSLLHEELTGRAADLGRPADESMTMDLLAAFGRPQDVATGTAPACDLLARRRSGHVGPARAITDRDAASGLVRGDALERIRRRRGDDRRRGVPRPIARCVMHRMPGALERELADLTAMTDHASTGAHDAYARLRGPLWATLHEAWPPSTTAVMVLVLGDGAPTLLAMPGERERAVDFLAARMVPLGAPSPAAAALGPTSASGGYDLVVASLPWADVQLRDTVRWAQRVVRQAQMTITAATLARPGGLIAVLATHDVMDAPDPRERRAILQHAAFLGAVRLPAGALRPRAGTDNVVDLMMFTAADPPHGTPTPPFETTVEVSLPGGDVLLNRYFDDHPEQVLGSVEVEVEASVWGRPSLTVVGDRAVACTRRRRPSRSRNRVDACTPVPAGR